MDIIDRHFAAANAHDVQATLDTYTEDTVWDDVTHPDAPFHGKQAVGEIYSSIIDAIPDVLLTSVKRYAGDGFVVDESILSGHVHGEWVGHGRRRGSRCCAYPAHFRNPRRADLLRKRLVRRIQRAASDPRLASLTVLTLDRRGLGF